MRIDYEIGKEYEGWILIEVFKNGKGHMRQCDIRCIKCESVKRYRLSRVLNRVESNIRCNFCFNKEKELKKEERKLKSDNYWLTRKVRNIKSGDRFGKLKFIEKTKVINKLNFGTVLCDCGTLKEVSMHSLISNNPVFSCGKCLPPPTNFIKHGMFSGDRIILCKRLNQIKRRCYNVEDSSYYRYGARGITVCDEWLGVEGVKNFVEWAESHTDLYFLLKCGYQIDRIDNNGPYAPWNCRITRAVDNTNNRECSTKITFNGQEYPIAELSQILGLREGTVRDRIKRLRYSGDLALYGKNIDKLLKNSRSKLNEDGYVIVPGLFHHDNIRTLLEDFQHLISSFTKSADDFDNTLIELFKTDPELVINCGKTIQNSFKLYSFMMYLNPLLKFLGMVNPIIATKPVFFFNNKNIAKHEYNYKTPIHNDFSTVVGSLNSLVVWAPLVDCLDSGIGPLEVIPGSHKMGLISKEIVHGFAIINGQDERHFKQIKICRGDAIIFNSFLIHRSGNNIYEDRVRYSMSFRFSDTLDPNWINRKYCTPYTYKPEPQEWMYPNSEDVIDYFKEKLDEV